MYTRLYSNRLRSFPKKYTFSLHIQSSSITSTEIVKWNMAITNHMRNGQINSAHQLFDKMPRRTSVSWNTMISGYINNNKFELARKLFDEMPQRDLVSWNIMLSGYVKNKKLSLARVLFEEMPKRDVVSWNTMLSGYAQNGYVDEARGIFERMPEKNDISWNGILAAYVQNGRFEDACRLFEAKEDWEIVSWNAIMAGYVKKKRLGDARRLFERMSTRDVVSWNTMISGYAQSGDMLEARKLFQQSPVRDVFTWTAMISGYVQNKMLTEARGIFDEMPEKNAVSWNAIIVGYTQCRMMDLANDLFEAMPCRNISSWNAMITGYAQNGEITRARDVFNAMAQRDSISWSAMIAAYAQCGQSEEALHLFVEMKRNGERMNRSAFTCALSTCADMAALDLGKQVHGRLVKAGYEMGCYVGNALLAMYCKCGSIEEAYDVFGEMPDKDLVTWNTMITGYAKHGFGKEALQVFESMKRKYIRPDDVTMIGVLSACSHSGLVDKGTEYFHSMGPSYGITAKPQHYTCMIDLLGRAGFLDKAQDLMENMPCEPDAATWGALLGSSRVHGNTELAEKAAHRIFEMEPDNSGMYVLLSNLYASSGKWSEVRKMRVLMRDKGVHKVPGYSWIEVQNRVHTFSVGDSVHPEKDRIYAYLEGLAMRLKKEGFVSSTKMALHDVEEEEKEHMLRYHSEKLAVAYGILTIPKGRPIRVIKNLRVCEDCHNAIKYISKIEGRLIILRDSNRFHHFKDGSCSCGDYW
ncbi:hypothetical protein ACHQM5_009729 [Ranunculus cassubicifolius]